MKETYKMMKFLSKKELQMITDALLFSSSCEIIGNFDDTHMDDMVHLAKKLKSNPSQNISLYKGGRFEEPERSELIKKGFSIRHEK